MKVAFLNLCHCEPEIVARVAKKLTSDPDFDMYIHVDAKQDIRPFQNALEGSKVTFLENRQKVYWGGYNAIRATFALLQEAMDSNVEYDYFVLLQNLDYPIRSNAQIKQFFEERKGTEFLRGCKIGGTKDRHYQKKFKIYNKRDDDFYLSDPSKIRKYMRYAHMLACSITTIGSNGILHENGEELCLYYGTAQWAITRDFAKYLLQFEQTHPKFNQRMEHIQFPDEEYFHTVLHNSRFKYHCMAYDEPEQRWLVNWRNIHYFEFPKAVTVFDESYFDTIMSQKDMLFCRKVKSGISDRLMDMIDDATR